MMSAFRVPPIMTNGTTSPPLQPLLVSARLAGGFWSEFLGGDLVGYGFMQCGDFGEHPGLVVVAGGGHGLVDADDREAVFPGLGEERFGERVGDLLVVEEYFDFVAGEEAVLEGDVLG